MSNPTIQAMTSEAGWWQYGSTGITLRIFALTSFWTEDGNFVPFGIPTRSDTCFLELAVTVNGDESLTIPSTSEVPVTSHDPSVKLYAAFYENGSKRTPFLEDFVVPASLGSTTTWGDIELHNRARARVRDDETYNKQQVDLLVATRGPLGVITLNGETDVPLSSSNQAKFYHDADSGHIRVSQNGGSYTDLVQQGGLSGLVAHQILFGNPDGSGNVSQSSNLTYNNSTKLFSYSGDGSDTNQSSSFSLDGKGKKLIAHNPNANNDLGSTPELVADYLLVYTNNVNSPPTFGNIVARKSYLMATSGQNDPLNSGNQAKKSFIVSSSWGDFPAAGQRFAEQLTLNAYGLGDAFISSQALYSASGIYGAGDEGTALTTTHLGQFPVNEAYIVRPTISAVITPATINTTLTQNVTKSKDVQSVTVASTTGVSAGQWVTVDRGSGLTSKMEAVKVTAVGANSISGVFLQNHDSGATILPATVLQLSSTSYFGQFRSLINLSASAYTTGTIASTSGTQITGSGTSWSDSMVGGDASLPGYFSATADDYSGTGFGTTALKTWYPISQVTSGTTLNIWHYNGAGVASYSGNAPSGGTGYTIRPGARILMFDGSTTQTLGTTVVLEYNTFTWSVGQTVECPPSPDGAVNGYITRIGWYTPGATLDAAYSVLNEGGQTFTAAYSVGNISPEFSVNKPAFGYAFEVNDWVQTALKTGRTISDSIVISSQNAGEKASIYFASVATTLEATITDASYRFRIIGMGNGSGTNGGTLAGSNAAVFGYNSLAGLSWYGNLQLDGEATGIWPLHVFKLGSDTITLSPTGSGNSTITVPQLTGTMAIAGAANATYLEATSFKVSGNQVVGARKTGWSAATGTAARTTYATFAGQTISASPTQAEVQAIDDHVKILSQRLKALIDDLHQTAGHGLIGT